MSCLKNAVVTKGVSSEFIRIAIQRIFKSRNLDLPLDEIPGETELKANDRVVLDHIVQQKKLIDIGYRLYMISINYKQYIIEHKQENLIKYFDGYYHQFLIPTLLGSHGTRASKRHLWPIAVLTMEENTAHRTGKLHDERVRKGINKPVYHQHASIAVHPSHIERFNKLVGTRKYGFVPGSKFESIDIRKANEFGVMYCLKYYNKDSFVKEYGPIIPSNLISHSRNRSANDDLINYLADTIKAA